MPPDSLRILLAGLVDYAGLFPPASLSMADVATNYAAYGASSDASMLGRLVVPVARLGELTAAMAVDDRTARGTWRISALATDDHPHDAAQISAWNVSNTRAVVDSVELRASSASMIADAVHAFQAVTVFVEVPLAGDTSSHLDAIQRAGARAKIRTGGVTTDAFPASRDIAGFLRACADRHLAFKATAGLHHPLRNSYRLTYAADAPRGEMFGFLNVFLAAAFAFKGMAERELRQLLEERDASTLRFAEDAISWRDETIDAQRLTDIRTSFAIAFGSCSFREPVDDLQQLGLL